MITNHVVLTETQRGILQIALEIARDKFNDNVRVLEAGVDASDGSVRRLATQFDTQAAEAEKLLSMVTLAEYITITEVIE